MILPKDFKKVNAGDVNRPEYVKVKDKSSAFKCLKRNKNHGEKNYEVLKK